MLPQKIAIVGMGASGRSAYRAAESCGIAVRGFDRNETTFVGDVVVDSDPLALAERIIEAGFDVAVASPGISPHSSLLQSLTSNGVELWSEVELAWRIQENGPHTGRDWLVVTGTNGKTTTVGLLRSILTAAGLKAVEVGNVGLPISSQVNDDAEVFVVEISSFQLETTRTVCPDISICLNIEADHVDWHGNVSEYQRAKALVYDRTRHARVYFSNDPQVKEMAINARGAEESRLVAVGKNFLARVGNDFTVDGEVIVRGENVEFWKRRGYSSALAEDIQAAAALALLYGVPPLLVHHGIEIYEPDAHRQALVANKKGVNWINDSKATNAHAAAAALRDQPDGTVVWIVGGDTKGQTFDELVKEVSSKLRAAILIGTNRQPIVKALERYAPGVAIVDEEHTGQPQDWMPKVVKAARVYAQKGDSVILAPACASWDQFVSYAQRGEIFTNSVLSTERAL